MTDKRTPFERSKPPENEDEWGYIWKGAHRGNEGWIVIGPLVAAVKNWKAWIVVGAIVAYIRGPEILAIIATAAGAIQ